MIELTKQIITYYLKNKKEPSIKDLKIKDISLTEKKQIIFVTIYKSGNIIGSVGTIKETQINIILELIKNTCEALNDKRASGLGLQDIDNLKIRLDTISTRDMIKEKQDFTNIDPVVSGVIVIKKDYEKATIILPNISSACLTNNDLVKYLGQKLEEEFVFEDYICYKITTLIESNI